MSTYEVRIWTIREYQGRDRKTKKPRATYRVRWEVTGKEFGQSYQTKALAESFRSKLVVAQREGVAFDEVTGLPEPMARELNSRTWYEHAVAFVDMKWPRASAKHRKSIADALATVTPALLTTDRGRPHDKEIRAALYGWSFNKLRRGVGPPPVKLAATVAWLEGNTVKLSALSDGGRVRQALDCLATKMDGQAAAANTVIRKRAVFSGALSYAIELRLLDHHPFDRIKWSPPKSSDEVDRRSVANPRQAIELFTAVKEHMPELVAFFGCLYYSALRPEEALHLRKDEYDRPKSTGGWGWLHPVARRSKSAMNGATEPAPLRTAASNIAVRQQRGRSRYRRSSACSWMLTWRNLAPDRAAGCSSPDADPVDD